MSKATKESTLVSAIRRAVLARWPGSTAWKIHGGPHQVIGIPDLVCCVGGRMVGIEVKLQRPGESEEHARGRVTHHQRAQLDAINAAGGLGIVALSVEEALELTEVFLA